MANEAVVGIGEQLFRQLKGVSGEKRQKLIDEINHSLGFDESTIQERTHANRLRCPRCGNSGRSDKDSGSNMIICYGNVKPGSKRQRYLCKECELHFNDHTGTALHKTKKLDRWPIFVKYLLDGLSIRQIAKEVGISPTTAQSWRKKLLTQLAQKMNASLSGIVEFTELSVKSSRKGQRKLQSSNTKSRETLVFCKSRSGHAFVAQQHVLELQQNFAKFEILWHSALMPATLVSSAERKLLNTDQADDFAESFGQEYARMRGTASDYLPLYAAWHQFRDETRHLVQREKIRRLLFAGL